MIHFVWSSAKCLVTELTFVGFFLEVHSLLMTVSVSNPPERLHTELTLMRFLLVVNCLFMHVEVIMEEFAD